MGSSGWSGFRWSSVCAFGALLLAACASAAAAADDAAVKARATQFWNARVQDDWKAVYDLTSPEVNAHLLAFDTTFGRLDDEVKVTGDGISVGADYKLSKHVDLRAFEIGYGSVTTVNSSEFNQPTNIGAVKLLNISTGFVFRFP